MIWSTRRKLSRRAARRTRSRPFASSRATARVTQLRPPSKNWPSSIPQAVAAKQKRRWTLLFVATLSVVVAAILVGRTFGASGQNVNTTQADASGAARAGDYSRCVAGYSRVIQTNPQSVAALAGRAQCELGLRDGGGAVEDLNQAIRLSPRDPALVLTRGEAYAALGNISRAADDYVQVSRSSVASPDQDSGAVRGLLELNLSGVALSAARAEVQTHAATWQVMDAFASALAASGARSEAEQQYMGAFNIGDPLQKGTTMAELAQMQRVSGNLTTALHDADQAVSFNPRWEHYRLRAEIRQAAGDLSSSDGDLGRAIRLASASWWPDQATTVAWLLDERARLRLEEGLVSGAVADLHAAIARAPDQETRRALQSELAAIQTPS